MATLLFKIVYHLAIFFSDASLSFVNAQNLRIQIQPPSVHLGQDDLVVTCFIISPSQLSTVYTILLLKNNSDTMESVVSVRSNNGDMITWQDTVLQNRASAEGTVSSPAIAQLRLTIPKERMQCPHDFTGYKCTMAGFSSSAVNQETYQMYVSYIVHPTMIEMPTVRILGEFSATPNREFPVGTSIQLTCTGQIGSDASATIRWCAKKSQDFTMTGLPQTPIHSQVSPAPNCQYTRSSTITYNLTSDDTYTQFLCESGYSGLCETGTAKQYLNITLDISQNLGIQLQPPSVTLGHNDLVVACSIISPSQLDIIYSITLLKNNSDTMKGVVSIRSSNGQDTITWLDTDLQNRASVIGTVSSPATSQLKLTIPRDRVQCPHDFTGYKCTMTGFGSSAVNQETSQMYVSYIARPELIEKPTVRILGEFSDTPTREFPVGTAIQLTCTGQIGSDASATIRWCARKSQDFTMTGLTQTPILSQASPAPNCQYTRSSTITYNLTSDDTYTQFLCESGYSGLCETGTAKQYLNITLDTSQNLRIQVQPPYVNLGQDDLVIICSIISPSQLDMIYIIALLKNNSDTMKDVVSVRSSNGQDVTTWQDSDLQNRASAIGTVNSPVTSQLKLTIPRDRVQCPRDFTGYKCTMSGLSSSAVNQETSQTYVSYIARPEVMEMPTVRILDEFSNTPTREFPVGTVIQLTCTGQIGSDASATIRWCAKKSQDFTMTGLPQTPIHSQVSPAPNCQYTRSSTITYNLTSDDTYTQFLCESGYSDLCETGTAKQYVNITLERSISTQSSSNCVSTNENLSIIFGSLFGVFFCICIGLMILIFFYKISKQHNRKYVGRHDKNGDYVMQTVSGFDDHQYQGFGADGRRTGHHENRAQYDVLGRRDPGNVYDRIGDINAERH